MRIIRFIHRWTGLIIGLFFIFSCLSGMLIIFGKMIGSYSPVFKVARQFHTTLFAGNTGEYILSYATLGAVVEIITGYILWLRRTAGLTRSLRKKHKNPLTGLTKNLSLTFPDKLSGLHSAGGFWSGVPLLLMALTALTWCFGWYSDFVYFLFQPTTPGTRESILFHTLHALHVGSWYGILSRILWFTASAIGVSLPVTGLLLFIRRLPHKKTGKIS